MSSRPVLLFIIYHIFTNVLLHHIKYRKLTLTTNMFFELLFKIKGSILIFMLTIDSFVNLSNYSAVISAQFNTFTPLAMLISILQNSTDYAPNGSALRIT